jgi:hypothetical protein
MLATTFGFDRHGLMRLCGDDRLTASAAIAYWDLLHDAVAACQPPGTSEADVLRGCAATWGTVYGIARLATLQQIPKSVPSEFDRLIHQALDTLRLGWAQGGAARPRA